MQPLLPRIVLMLIMLRRRQDDEFDKERKKLLRRLRAGRRQRAIKLQQERRLRAKARKHKRLELLHKYYTEVLGLKTVWVYPRTSDWWENTAKNYNDEQWLQDFRVSRETFSYICSTLKPALQRRDSSFRLCIPLEKRVAIALYKLASTVEYRTVANLFAVGLSTVCTCVHKFCQAVISHLRPKLIQPPNQAKLAEMADYFETSFGIPQCVGVIDGSHIPILKPPQYQSDFCNRKGWHSIILQAVVDGKGMFWDLNIGQPGGENDTSVLRKSNLWTWASTSDSFSGRVRNICGTDVSYFILGDSAYPLESWLLKPYSDSGQLTQSQELYNDTVHSALCVVERAFGRLKGRWRCLSKRNDCSVNVVVDMVEACCTLHNLIELRMDTFLLEWDFPECVVQPQPGSGDTCPSGSTRSAARCALEQLFTEQQ